MITKKIKSLNYNYQKEELLISYKDDTKEKKVVHMSKGDYEKMIRTCNFKFLDNV